MTFRERLEWVFRMALMLFILASVAFLSALLAVRFTIQGREVAVPDVVGKKAIEAQQMLQGRGINIKIEDHIYNPLPVDEVVRQSPPAGSKVKVGQYAHVVLSLGPQKATIPLLEERSLRAARIELMRTGMQIGEISSFLSSRHSERRNGSSPGSRARENRHHQSPRESSRVTRPTSRIVHNAGTCRPYARGSGSKNVGSRTQARQTHLRAYARRATRHRDRATVATRLSRASRHFRRSTAIPIACNRLC